MSLARLREVVPSVVPADGDEELGGPGAAPVPPAEAEPSGSHAVSEIDPEAVPGGGAPEDAPPPVAPAEPLPAPDPAQAAAAQGFAAALVSRSVTGSARRPAVDQDRTRVAPEGAPGQARPLSVDEAARLVARGSTGA